MSIINPILKEHVVPQLSKIMEVIQSPMNDAFVESYKYFDQEVISKWEPKATVDENKKEFHTLDCFPYSWKMYDITRKADVMYDPLWALNIIFPDIYPWSLIWTAHDTLRGKMDNAIYTFEQKLIEEQGTEQKDMKACADKIKHLVLADYQADGTLARILYYKDILKEIVMPPFNKLVFPAVEAILEPLNSAIPEPVKEFLDINEMFQTIVISIIDESLQTVLAGAK
jgi:hypothetical protein